jgi:hypothetical protein
MQVITIGRRLVPAAQIAFIEAFDPAANPEFQPDKVFKGRVVLLNRDAVLTEMTPQEFAGAHDLRLFAEDNVAVNASLAFRSLHQPNASNRAGRTGPASNGTITTVTSRAGCW